MEIAGETRSDARMASEGPRATGTSRPGGLSYGKGIETGRSLLPEIKPRGLSYQTHRFMKHPHLIYIFIMITHFADLLQI